MKCVVVISTFLLIAVSYVQADQMWKLCEGVADTGKVISVLVNGKSDTCVFKKGTSVNFTMSFQPGEASKTLTALVHGEVFGSEVSFPLKNPNGCVNSGITCPLVAGKTYTYHTSIDVLKIYPTMGVVVKWENTGDDKKDILCIELDCNIE